MLEKNKNKRGKILSCPNFLDPLSPQSWPVALNRFMSCVVIPTLKILVGGNTCSEAPSKCRGCVILPFSPCAGDLSAVFTAH